MNGHALIAVDFGAESAAFVRRASSFTNPLGLVASLLCVAAPMPRLPHLVDGPLNQRVRKSWEQIQRRRKGELAALMDLFPSELTGEVHWVVGDPLVEIGRRSSAYQLVVLGNVPARGLARLKHGAVAERFTRFSEVPTLILPSSSEIAVSG